MYYVTTIQPDGLTKTEKQDETPDNVYINERLGGGYLGIVPHFERYGDKPCVAFCDEGGKLKSLALNPRATYLWYACLAPGAFIPDTLHGNVVIVTADTAEELGEL